MRKIVILLFSILLVSVIYYHYHTPLRVLELDAPRGKVVVKFDDYGISHITALNSDMDAFYALGYIHAMDRLWQLEFQRHTVQGRLSEIYGKLTVDADKYLRLLNLNRYAAASYPHFNSRSKEIISSYTQGINAYLNTHSTFFNFHLLFHTVEPWTNVDSIAWQKMMAWNLQNAWEMKISNYQIAQRFGNSAIQHIFIDYPEDAPTVIQSKKTTNLAKRQVHALGANEIYYQQALSNLEKDTEKLRNQLQFQDVTGKGSNAWVIKGEYTRSHKPILANDTHLGVQIPSSWYLAELTAPNLHVIGASVPGLPGIIIGRNDNIAWGITVANLDTQDLIIANEKTNLKTEKMIIKVRGARDLHLRREFSKDGPVINYIDHDANFISPKVILKWVGFSNDDRSIEALIQLDYAKNWKQFNTYLQSYVSPALNFFYADTKNNIGYHLAGQIPIKNNYDPALPVRQTDFNLWRGIVPYNDLPSSYNPPENFIISTNNKITKDSPYQLTFRWEIPPYRQMRIIDLLNQKAPLGIKENQEIQMDTVSYLWRDLKPYLIDTQPKTPTETKALAILEKWDGNMKPDSVAATIFIAWYSELEKMLTQTAKIKRYTAEPLYLLRQFQIKDCKEYREITLEHALKRLKQQFGDNMQKWQWAKMHTMNNKDLVFGNIPMLNMIWNRQSSGVGENYTVNNGGFDLNTGEQLIASTYRQVIDLGTHEGMYIIQPGQTDDIFSPHYSDLLIKWHQGDFISMSP